MIFNILFVDLSLSLKFEYNPISCCGDIPLFNILRSSSIWSSELKFKIWVWSYKLWQRYSTFNILGSSSIGGCLHLKDFWNMVWWSYLKFKIWVQSNKWLRRYSTLNILRLSSIEGHLHFKNLSNLVWSSKLKFKIWVWSNKWLLRYSTFIVLRSSSIGGCLHKRIFKTWFGDLSLSLKVEYDPISGCGDIPLLIFWGRLPLKVIFLLSICKIWFGLLSLSFKFEHDPIIGYWDIPLFTIHPVGWMGGWVVL